MPSAEDGDDALALVQRLLADDPEAWRRFASDELQFMEWVCTRTLERSGLPFSVHDVADDVATALLRLLEKDRRLLRRFDGRARLSTYVGIVARSASLERLRSGRSAHRNPTPREQEAPSPAEDLLRHETLQAVRQAMAALPGPERAALEAFYDRGLTYARIAETLGVPAAEVKALLASAKAHLGVLLGKT